MFSGLFPRFASVIFLIMMGFFIRLKYELVAEKLIVRAYASLYPKSEALRPAGKKNLPPLDSDNLIYERTLAGEEWGMTAKSVIPVLERKTRAFFRSIALEMANPV